METNNKIFADTVVRAQAFLFAEGGPLSLRKLAQLVGCNATELSQALDTLSKQFEGTGLALVRTDTEASITVSALASEHLKSAYERELERDIGDAGLEVLAILLYRGPSTRAEIDYIRGVNTSTTLRTLLVRGLVMRGNNPSDGREYLYRPTAELLAHLGVTDTKNLPDYATIASELASFVTAQESAEQHGRTTDTAHDAGEA